MSALSDVFLQNTYTTTQAKRRLVLLRFFLDSKLFGGTKTLPDVDVNDQVWIGSLNDNFLKEFDKDNIASQLKALSDELAKMPVLTMLVAIEIPEDKLSELGNWCRQQFQKQILVEPKIDPRLIAGCSLIWNGIYRDYSVKAKIEADQTQILQSFQDILK